MVMYFKIIFASATAIIVLLILLFQLIFVYYCTAEIQNQNYSTDKSAMSAVPPSTSSAPSACKIEPELLQEFQDRGKTTFIVSMKKTGNGSGPLDDFDKRTFATREERLNAVHKALTDSTEKSQKNVLDFLETEKARRTGAGTGASDSNSTNSGFTYESLWVSNQIVVKEGDLKLAQDLEKKFDEITKISHDRIFDLID